jgi:integrase
LAGDRTFRKPSVIGSNPIIGSIRYKRRRIGYLCRNVNLTQSLQNWAAVQGIGKKSRTKKYHSEIVATILRDWPGGPDADTETVTDQELTDFLVKVGHLSAPRYNAIVSALRVTLRAARSVKRRRVTMKDRPLLSQLEFSRLLVELDKRPQSHAGLIVRFLAHTGLRINEARQLRWSDVQEKYFLAPGSITKSGRPRVIPFVNGIGEVLERLRSVTGHADTILPQAEVKRSLQTACRLANVPRLSHHDFRHLFATRCVQSGVDMPTVARWLGHQDGGALLAKTYYHLVDEHSRKMAAKVEI